MASGGPRVPAKPAAVAGPGRFATRTDSGTAQVAAPGGAYGERQAIESQAGAAPVPVGQGNTQPSPGPDGGGASIDNGGVFGPTQRPNESPLEGVPGPGQGREPNVEMMLRAMYQQFPTPYLGRLMNG